MYILYINGYLVIQSKRAIMFVGSGRGKKARFSGCTGYIKRVVKFEENREYYFSLSTELSKGEVSVELLDRNGKSVLPLDCSKGTGYIMAEARRRYDLVIRFQSASGKYELDWI